MVAPRPPKLILRTLNTRNAHSPPQTGRHYSEWSCVLVIANHSKTDLYSGVPVSVLPAKLDVVLPAYNEQASIDLLLQNAIDVIAPLPQSARIIVVDDGSTDRTAGIVRSFTRQGVELVSHGRNRGLHEAVRTGLLEALDGIAEDGVIVVMDADNTHHPELIPQMVARIDAGADVVIASRFAPGGKMIGAPLIRRVYSLGARTLLTMRYPTCGARDFTCGYRAYRAETL